jgi:hypothetical protein
MSTVLTRRRRSGRGRERDRRQPSLFSQVVAPPAPVDEPRAATIAAPAPAATPEYELPAVEPAEERLEDAGVLTLDEAISGLWRELLAGETGDCPVCGSAMLPRHTAGAGVVGGRCGSCATTLA